MAFETFFGRWPRKMPNIGLRIARIQGKTAEQEIHCEPFVKDENPQNGAYEMKRSFHII